MKLPLTEPQRGYTLLQKGITLSDQYPRLAHFSPIGADIFVLIYPIFLLVFYFRGIAKKQIESKQGALFIFFSCLISILINIAIQSFFLKNRPNIDLFSADAEETLFHGLLPNSSFPSDHAVVGMSVAIATLIWGYKTRSPRLKYF
ncbi:MAG: hypothetical protein LBG52_02455 [Candidatus Peribacteria bacterium]|jgi:membrane-associated phospholipid phosphatase|nr:hypothetical protein [Candidatus Peribacteria bacterium]